MNTKQATVLSMVGGLMLGAIFFLSPHATAQTADTELLITWRAESYVPNWYSGKILPTASSPIVASVALITNGVITNLSAQNIYWYLNNQLIAQGVGLDTVVLRAPNATGGIIRLRADLPDKNITRTAEVPVVAPQAVIFSPFIQGNMNMPRVDLRGLPFFFNTKSLARLTFNWQINGEAPNSGGEPQNLVISLASGTPAKLFKVNLTIVNSADDSSAIGNVSLNYTP